MRSGAAAVIQHAEARDRSFDSVEDLTEKITIARATAHSLAQRDAWFVPLLSASRG
jgi:hypothetical protein